MFDFHEKRRIRSFIYSKTVAGILFVLALLLLNSVHKRYVASEDMQRKLEVKMTELEDLKTRAAALESRVDYLQNERGVEEELRNRFDVVKEGEKIVILLDERHEKEEVKVVEEVREVEKSIVKKVIEYVTFWKTETI